MTTITLEKAIVHRALSALEYHTQQTRPIHNTELVIEELRAVLAAPATALALTEEEVQELLELMSNKNDEPVIRKILGVPTP